MDISYQLYSSRDHGPVEKTLAMVAAARYTQVEGYSALFSTPAEAAKLKRALDDHGLTMPTAHLALAALEDDPDACITIAKTLDLKVAYIPYLDEAERPVDLAGWRVMGDRAQKALAPLKNAGLMIGWHNHDFEFTDIDSTRILDALIEGGPDLTLELDLAWVFVAGHDPVETIKRYDDRISSVHLKDRAPKGEATDEDGWADVGHGVLDWPQIKAAVDQSAARYFIVEHDNPSDDQRFATRSIETVKKIWSA